MTGIMVMVMFVLLIAVVEEDWMQIPTTLDGPFTPVTVSLANERFGINPVDLPDTDRRVLKTVTGFEPKQISVSLSAKNHSAWISWITGDFQIGDDIEPLDPSSVASVVRYSERRDLRSPREATGDSLVYDQLYPPFEGLNNYSFGIIHHVLIIGLEPRTEYYYSCGDPSIKAMSKISVFRTMPISSPWSYPERIAIPGNLGLYYNTTTTVEHMRRNKPDLFLLIGDVSYANLYLTNGSSTNCYSCSF